jgi:hypothetical protein
MRISKFMRIALSGPILTNYPLFLIFNSSQSKFLFILHEKPERSYDGICSEEKTHLCGYNRLLKKSSFPGCSKRARCKAPEILRSEAYLAVRCNDEG